MQKLKVFLNDESYLCFPRGTFDVLILLVFKFLKRALLDGLVHGRDVDSDEGVCNIAVGNSPAEQLLVTVYLSMVKGFTPQHTNYLTNFFIAKIITENECSETELAGMFLMREFLDLIIYLTRDNIEKFESLGIQVASPQINHIVVSEAEDIRSYYKG